MIEKSYEKEVELTASQSVLTRLANRLIKDWCEVNETSTPSDEIKEVAEKIKNMEDVEDVDTHLTWTSDSYFYYGRRDYDKVNRTYEEQYSAFVSIVDDCYYVRWYFFTNSQYEKRIGDKVYRARTSEEIIRENYRHRGKYRYYCTHRPPSPGGIPEGYVHYEQYRQGSEHLGEVTYDEKPSDHDCEVWGLVLDKDYEREREMWLKDEPV